MTTMLQLLNRLDRTFEGGEEGKVARKLLSFLINYPDTTNITLQLMRQIIRERLERPIQVRTLTNHNTDAMDAVIIRTLQFLSAGESSVLEAKFELIEDEISDQAPYILSEEELRAAVTEGINPISGDVDPHIKRKVAIFFAPTCNMKNLLLNTAVDGGER